MGLISGIRYVGAEIRENGDNPVWWQNRIQARVNAPVQQAIYGDAGLAVMEQDWDTLVIVDACRADTFETVVELEQFDEYRRVKSKGSATSEWSRKNFARDYDDTVYVTAIPAPTRHAGGEFVHFEGVWEDAFDEDLGTIPPDAVTEAARELHAEYPNKRLIVHYAQPHYPFVGGDFDFSYWRQTDGIEFEGDERARDAWDAVGQGLADEDEVWSAYRDNLRYVMDDVWDLVDSLNGRTVIHSDHGNVVGDWSWPVPVRIYGHPSEVWLDGLRTVPWAVLEGDERRQITSGDIHVRERDADDRVEEKLAALGYVD